MAYGENDQGARIRAARCYAGFSQAELGKRLGYDTRKVVRAIENGETDPTVRQARAIAQACSFPLGLIITGWLAPPELEERVAELERQLRALERASATSARTEQIAKTVEEIRAVVQPGLQSEDDEDHPKAVG